MSAHSGVTPVWLVSTLSGRTHASTKVVVQSGTSSKYTEGVTNGCS